MSKRRCPSREDYTVGWVCALPVELAAAREMLDEEHEALSHDANDNNIYTRGRVGEHNVVIACLPAGKIGTNSAAAVAVEMNSVFPSIRFGLMVGIGGGVPSVEADIRLGDVVVSSPHKQHGGVVQYDLGKAAPSGFKQTGFVNSPPRILLNAVSNMQANQWVRKSRLLEYLSKLTDLPAFAHENAGPDVLFTAEYDHKGGATCEQCSKEKVIERQSRGQEIMVHYGTIASGNQVMRDGATRDRISLRLGGVLCFEMEAAGLMDSFPCLVIRGICDYADSHKNKRWQPYAAGTAAAYAKEALSVIPASEVAKSRTVDNIIQKNVLDTILNRLPYAVEAPFNSYQKQQELTCLPGTRVDLLREIYDWADRQDEHFVFWLNGLAGTGKSTIARTVARRYFEQGRLGASFFFSRGDGDVGYAGKFVTSIAVQLANEVSTLQHHICKAITKRSDIANRSLHDQWRQLVLGPLSELHSSSYPFSYVLVIDALDECDDENNIRIILGLLSEAQSLKTIRLRIFLTSRPGIQIQHGVDKIPESERQGFILHNIQPAIVNHDISLFLAYNLTLIQQEHSLEPSWPGEEDVKYLVRNASGLFIWAATACRFMREGLFPEKRLRILTKGGTSTATPEEHLNQIYSTVLQKAARLGYMEEEKQLLYSMLRDILGSIVVLLSPLSVGSLSRLLSITKRKVDRALEGLHSILDIPKDPGHLVRLHHPSFRDFLLDRKRCNDPNFLVDEKQAHRTLTDNCIRLMSKTLKQDICGVDAPGVLVTDVESGRVEQYLPSEVQYACLYWVQHIQKSEIQPQDDGQEHIFLQKHLLHWLEALSLMGKTPEGVLTISFLESYVQTSTSPNLYAFIHDAKRFALRHRSVIEYTPLQIYSSALIFTPETSITRRQFKKQLPSWIGRLPKTQLDWSATLQTLEGHTNSVVSVAFSYDGKLLASASWDKTVRLWDSATGAALQTLEGHTNSVDSVAFSHDGKLLASASWDKTVRLWDPATEAALQTLKGHTSFVNSVAFSHDGKLLASASRDKTVRLWDPATGAALQTLEGHTSSIDSVAFSYDGKLLASASWDKTVRLWDPTTGAALQTLGGHISIVSVAFSHDGKLLASASRDRTVRLWDPATGAALQTLEGHTSSVVSVAFSHDGKLLASASRDKTVRLWDPATGAALQTLEGHIDSVNSVAFSHDGKLLASASWDKTVRLWDPATGAALQTLKGHTDSVNSVAFSHDGKLLASASWDETVRLWDPATGAALQTLEGDISLYNISFSRDAQYLKTNRGSLSLQSSSNLSPAQVPSLYQILVKGDWITRDGENLLWLPSNYKERCSTLHDNILVLGHTSGEVTFIEFRS